LLLGFGNHALAQFPLLYTELLRFGGAQLRLSLISLMLMEALRVRQALKNTSSSHLNRKADDSKDDRYQPSNISL